jgi:hypothetical protein
MEMLRKAILFWQAAYVGIQNCEIFNNQILDLNSLI